uniref:Uncharacterized protein n=1 Tax=Tetradesmus obliquus TaxID=3088 RepID=A0A383W6B4_TETOB
MDSLQRSGSKLPHVPSFNDFCSGIDPSEFAPSAPVAAPAAPLKIPGMTPAAKVDMSRSWSMDSDDYTPRSARTPSSFSQNFSSARTPSSFSQTFSRALYEHMRTN